jgi:signal peptidase II
MQKSLTKYLLLILVLLAGGASDQFSKKWAAEKLKYQETRRLIPHVIELSYTENRGMVFGINNRQDNHFSKNILLVVRILLSIGLTVFIVYHRSNPFIFHFPFLLILSGAIGNVIDSLRFGHVVDFIHMHLGKLLDWPFLFNLADAYVCIGMGILLLQSFLGGKDKKKVTRAQSPATETPDTANI